MTIDRHTIASTRDHPEVIDALYRFGAGVDDGDAGLLATAFHDDATVDFGPCGRKIGLEFSLLTGGATIVGFLSRTAGTQTTTHVITNGRVQIDGGRATLRALVDATHLPQNDHSRRCRMMNWYEAELTKDAQFWRLRRLVIDNAWFTGDPQICQSALDRVPGSARNRVPLVDVGMADQRSPWLSWSGLLGQGEGGFSKQSGTGELRPCS